METFVALDLETTGLNADCDDIIEVGAVKFNNGLVESKYSSLVCTNKSLTSFLTKLTGITPEMLKEAPPSDIVWNEVRAFIGTNPLVFHNASFDLGFLSKLNGGIITNQCFDTLDLSKIAIPTLGSYRLSKLTEYCKLQPSTHRALADAEACGYVFLEVIKIFKNTPLSILTHYINLFTNPPNAFGDLLQKIYLQKLQTKGLEKIDSEFSFTKHSLAQGLFNDCKNEIDLLGEAVNFNLTEIQDLVSKEGKFAKKYPGFEFRQGQSQMLQKICAALTSKKFLVIEAATGTGKSLAYLLPAILWSLHRKEKVVISTHTINLQEQLILNDLPLLKKVLEVNCISVVIKGRNNYLCLQKWQLMLQIAHELSYQEKYFLARIVSWLQTTVTGDKSELNLKSLELEHWNKIAADSHTCLGKNCHWFENCFVMSLKKKAEQANILVTNHSLLLTDAKLENSVLPKHKFLIIDEAHNLEQEATTHLTSECSSYKMKNFIANLYNTNDKRFTGLLSSLAKHIKILPGANRESIETILTNAINNLMLLAEAFEDFSKSIKILDNDVLGSLEKEKWLKASVLSHSSNWLAVKSSAENVIFRLKTLEEYLTALSIFSEEELEDAVLTKNLQANISFCVEYQNNIVILLNLENEEQVTWLETSYDHHRFDFVLKSAPIEVGPLLHDCVFKEKETIVFTSATLTIEEDFSFFTNQVGLNLLPAGKLATHIVNSPYNMAEQAHLCIANNLPSPTEVDEEQYGQEIIPALYRLIRANKGRALVLFTSHRLLKQVYTSLKTDFEQEDIQLFGHQIDGSRTFIVEEFKKNEQAVIFGANSFWEGVDIPGSALTLIVIVKLPFQAPSIPTLAARMEYIKNKCQDPFQQLNLPQAIIKFKQGFGRLIRKSTDKGVVVVLDKRVIQKRYGKKFLNSLPLKTHLRGNDIEIAKFVLEME